MLRQKFVVSRQDFTELCLDRIFLCRDRVGNSGEILCHDIIFYVATECFQG